MQDLKQPSAPPKACLFDLDGLLLDTEPLHARAWQQAAQHFGTELATEQLLQLQGRRRHDNANLVCSWIEQPITPDQLLAVRQPIAAKLLPAAEAMEGAESLVRSAHRFGIATALVTSSDQKSMQRKIGNHPWVNRLQLMVCGDDPRLRAGKPAPDPFLLGAQSLGVSPEECWAFEDSEAGCRSALTAGCLVWRLLRNHEVGGQSVTKETLSREPGRLVTINRLSEAQHCLESLISTGD